MELTPSHWKIELTGPRRVIRKFTAWALASFAALAAIGYLLPAHKLAGESWHGNYADGGPFSLAVLVLVLATTLSLRNRKLGSGMVTGFVATGGAIAAAVPVILAHLFAPVTHGIGEGMFAVGELGLFFGGAVAFLSEPVLYILERRRAARTHTPRLPRAIALA